jgi:hypothetical protein
MPRFFAMLCLQKMRNGIGRPHTGFFANTLFCKKNNGMGELTIQQPIRCASSIL